MAILFAVLFAGVGFMIYYVAKSVAEGKIEVNKAVGIRLPALRLSHATWIAGHKAAVPIFHKVAIINAGIAALSILSTALPAAYVTLVVLNFLCLILGGAVGVFMANRAAWIEAGKE